mgnify:CR=1 FL=1
MLPRPIVARRGTELHRATLYVVRQCHRVSDCGGRGLVRGLFSPVLTAPTAVRRRHGRKGEDAEGTENALGPFCDEWLHDLFSGTRVVAVDCTGV